MTGPRYPGERQDDAGPVPCFGFSGHGFQLGSGVGDAMAELITTGRCETPLNDFRIDRFVRAA